MISTSIKYIVYTHGGSGVRHHHFSAQNNIVDEAPGRASPGDTFPAYGFATLPFEGVNVRFAFMSVHGAADGNHLYTSPGIYPVPVGTTDIDVLVVYAPVGGGSGGPVGVWVDAFDVDTGTFSDSDFIEVLTPPTPPDSVDGSKTTEANMEGDVSSVTAENLRAFAVVDGAPFLQWKRIFPTETLSASRDISLAQNETDEIWFAFYQTIPAPLALRRLVDRIEESLGRWVLDDYCGTWPPRPLGQPGPFDFQISLKPEITRSLTPAQQGRLSAYVEEYPAVAAAAFAEMLKVTSILGGVATILADAKSK
jgi:hypothetical protein